MDEHTNNPPPLASATPTPAWSIAIPAYNRPARLQDCLTALAGLDAPAGGFEVVVVDDGSSPPLAESVTIPDGLDARILRQDNAGPASARNHAVREARGAWIAFTDDDCQPRPGWLFAFSEAIDADPDRLVGGHTVNALTNCAPAEASQSLIDYLHDYFNTRGAGPTFFPSNNFCLAKQAYEMLGGFDEGFPLAAGEDRDFCDKALHKEMALAYQPRAVIDHRHGMTLRGFWCQHFNYGRGAYAFQRAKAGRENQPVRIERLSFYTGLVMYPMRGGLSLPRLTQSCLMAVSQVANVMGYAYARITAGREN